MSRTEIKAGTPEWIEARRTRITATDWATLVVPASHRPRWVRTELQLWERLTGRAPAEGSNESLEYGLWMEYAAAPWYEHVTGRRVERSNVLWTRNALHACTPDGWLTLREGDEIKHWGLWECKAPWWREDDWEDEAGDRHVPLLYQVQVQAQMFVTGAQQASVCALVRPKLLWGDVPRDEGFIRAAVERIETWHDRHVVKDTPPRASSDEADARVLALLHDPQEGKVVPMPPEIVELCDKIDMADSELERVKDLATGLKNSLRQWMQEQQAERCVDPAGERAWSFKPKGGLRRVRA